MNTWIPSAGTATTTHVERRRADLRRTPGRGARAQRRRRLVLIEERRLVVDALITLLEASGRFTVTAYTGAGVDVRSVAASQPDLVLVGAGPDKAQPLAIIAALHRVAPQIRTAILSDTQDPELIHCVLDNGVSALVLTGCTGEDLVVTLERVLRGHTSLPAGWQEVLADPERDPVGLLSPRQLEVLRLLADGSTYDQIARRLVITTNTVKFHVRSIYLRLGVNDRLAARKLLELHEPRHSHATL